MTARRVALLFAIGIVVIASAVWMSSRSQTGEDSIAGTKVLPGLESSVNDITEVRITKADKTQATLDRKATDWIVARARLPGRFRQAAQAPARPRLVAGSGAQDGSRAQLSGARRGERDPAQGHGRAHRHRLFRQDLVPDRRQLGG